MIAIDPTNLARATEISDAELAQITGGADKPDLSLGMEGVMPQLKPDLSLGMEGVLPKFERTAPSPAWNENDRAMIRRLRRIDPWFWQNGPR